MYNLEPLAVAPRRRRERRRQTRSPGAPKTPGGWGAPRNGAGVDRRDKVAREAVDLRRHPLTNVDNKEGSLAR